MMNIVLNKEPTNEDYFKAKLGDITFIVNDPIDIVRFNLLDYDRLGDMNIDFGIDHSMIFLNKTHFKHDVKVKVVDESLSVNDDVTIDIMLPSGERTLNTHYRFLKEDGHDNYHIIGLNLSTSWLKHVYPEIYKMMLEYAY